jgi:pyrimidine-nucleoside phosphorylase
MGRIAPNQVVGYQIAEEALMGNQPWSRFRDLVIAQGGDVSYIDHPEKLPSAQFVEIVNSPRSGYLSEINAQIVGESVVFLGGGRARKNDLIDSAVGLEVHHKVGNFVDSGEPLFTIHANKSTHISDLRNQLLSAHKWSDDPVEPLPLFYDVVTQENI